jgi:glycosyltransferase involved in cell wall biosynthesis
MIMTETSSTDKDVADITPDYSCVIPVYFNEGALTKILTELKEQVVQANPDYTAEIIFVDDGSGDGSFAELMRLREENPGLVKVVKFTRNFGQVNALMAGFAQARGRCVAAISADGQDPVEMINEMLTGYFKENYEIVVAHREERDESFTRKLTSQIFYSLMRRLSFPNMPVGGFDYFLLGRRALQVLLRNPESHPFLQGQILWTGFPIKYLNYRRQKREVGESRWTLGKKITYLIDGVMSYSFLPIRLMSILGALIALSGFIYAAVIIAVKLFLGTEIQGWAALMVVSLTLGGIQLIMLGIIGEYMWRTLAEARKRDPYVIEETYE